MESSFSFSTATEKHEKHSEAIDFTVDKSSLKEVEKQNKKENNTIEKKKKIFIEQIESGIPSINDAFNKNIDKSFVSQWTQNKKEIIDGASNQYLKLFKKNRKSSKHETKLKKKLYQRFKETRSRGLKVSFSWLYTTSNVLSKALTQNLKRLSKTVVVLFL